MMLLDIAHLLDGFADYGYIGLFIASFLAATILPFGSEFVFVALLGLKFDIWTCIIVASIGNFLGGLTNYYLGKLGKMEWIEKYCGVKKAKLDKMHAWLENKGAVMGFFSFLPIVGDLIAVALGYMRCNIYIFSISMFVGKFARYVLIAYGVDWAMHYN